MRSGFLKTDKGIFEIKSFITIIIIIILFVALIASITLFKNSKVFKKDFIEIDISKIEVFDNLKDVDNTIVKASLYETITPSIPSTDCSSHFINAHAMVVGDSTAEGLTAYGILDDSSVVWTRGRTIQYFQEDLRKAAESNPSIVFLAYGANDLLSWNGNVTGYINAYRNSINYVHQILPNAKIYVNSILPVSDYALSKNSAYKYEDEFNTNLKSLCNEMNVTYIDNRELLKQNTSGSSYESDGVHPRPFYYKLWANNMIAKSGI